MCQGCPEMWQPYTHSCLRFAVSFHDAERHILIICSLSPFQKPPCLPLCVASPPTHLFSFFSFCRKILFSDSWFKAIDPISNTGQGDQWISQKRFSMRSPHTMFLTSLGVFCDLNEGQSCSWTENLASGSQLLSTKAWLPGQWGEHPMVKWRANRNWGCATYSHKQIPDREQNRHSGLHCHTVSTSSECDTGHPCSSIRVRQTPFLGNDSKPSWKPGVPSWKFTISHSWSYMTPECQKLKHRDNFFLSFCVFIYRMMKRLE